MSLLSRAFTPLLLWLDDGWVLTAMDALSWYAPSRAEVLRFAAENAGPSRAEHFNGVPGGDYIGHDNCSPESGGCRFQSAAENQADLEAWYAGQEPEAGS